MDIYLVDAFTDQPYKGNPAAVCILDQAPLESWMQSVANEMSVSETAFLWQRDEAYELQWFTPQAEVDLCGHATLASAHVLWETEMVSQPDIHFRTKSGNLSVTKEGSWMVMDFPLEVDEPCSPPEALIEGLGGDHVGYVGKNRHEYIVEVESEAELLQMQPNFSLLRTLDARGVIVTSRTERTGIDFVSRCFYPALGVNEDPVTGSAHCCLGPYWQRKQQKGTFTAMQLSKREGRLTLTLGNDRIHIAGQAVTTLRGKLLAERD